MTYKELKETLIKKGADAKLFDMPAIRERLEGKSISADDVTINPDGTFNFGNFTMSKVKIKEKKETEEREVLAIVETGYKTMHKNAALDAPFSASIDYEGSYESLVAKLFIVDEAGFEIEMQEIDNSSTVKKSIEDGTLSYETFQNNPGLISTRYKREDGIIQYATRGDFTRATSSENRTYYNHGHWRIENPVYDGPSQEKAFWDQKYSGFVETSGQYSSVGYALNKYNANTDRILRRYPQLKEYCEKQRAKIYPKLSQQGIEGDKEHRKSYEDLEKENAELRLNNEKLQAMLQKALSFAQTVRDSRVGKLFFGKKAKEVLGEQDKDAKQLLEGR